MVGVRGWVDVGGSREEERGRVDDCVCLCVCVWRCASGENISQELICIMWSNSLFRPVIISSLTKFYCRAIKSSNAQSNHLPPVKLEMLYSDGRHQIKLLHVYSIADEESSPGSAVTFMCTRSAATVRQTQSQKLVETKTEIKTEWKSSFLMMMMTTFVSEWILDSTQTSHQKDTSWRASASEASGLLRLSNVSQPTSARRWDVALCLLDIMNQIRFIWSWTESCFSGQKKSPLFVLWEAETMICRLTVNENSY